MDTQINTTGQVMDYLPKYMTKIYTCHNLSVGQETMNQYMSGRKIDIVQAIYTILGFHWHQNSIGVVYIDTTIPEQLQRRSLRNLYTLNNLPDNSMEIYTRSHLEKYLNRHPQLHALTIAEYYIAYKILSYSQDDDDLDNGLENEEETKTGFIDRGGYHRREPTIYVQHFQRRLPRHATDKKKQYTISTSYTESSLVYL
jgi:hypothetical protein